MTVDQKFLPSVGTLRRLVLALKIAADERVAGALLHLQGTGVKRVRSSKAEPSPRGVRVPERTAALRLGVSAHRGAAAPPSLPAVASVPDEARPSSLPIGSCSVAGTARAPSAAWRWG